MVHSTNAGLMLGHRLRRCPNINPSLFECAMFAGWCAASWLFPPEAKLPVGTGLVPRSGSEKGPRPAPNPPITLESCEIKDEK